MLVVKDAFDSEVAIGDFLVHIVKHSTSVGIHYSVVYGFIWHGNEKEVSMKVVSVRKTWRGEYKYYRATLTENNFVRTTIDAVPENIRKGLLDKVKY